MGYDWHNDYCSRAMDFWVRLSVTEEDHLIMLTRDLNTILQPATYFTIWFFYK